MADVYISGGHKAVNVSDDPMLARSPDSAAMVDFWNRVDAVMGGIRAMREAGEDYLPRFIDESADEYKARLKMTKMTNVYRDIIEGLSSKPFEEEVKLLKDEDDAKAPQRMIDFVDNVDGSSNSMHVFAGNTFFNGINSAMAWIFVDYSKKPDNVRNMRDAQRAGLRAYWSHVEAKNVLWATSTVINGEEVLTYFKMYEPGDTDHIREFVRDDDGNVTWTLYEHRKDTRKMPDGVTETHFHPVDGGPVSIGVIPMVPFITGRRNGRTWQVSPTMEGALDLQVELYQMESGLKFAKNLTAYPMLAANGIAPPKGLDGKPIENVPVGPNRVLWAPPNGDGSSGSWQYLEPSSESLKFLSGDINDTIVQLRELGRQPLTANSGNITVITAAVAAGKARSAVKQWALMLKDALENALKITALWENITNYKPRVHVFIEFDDYLEADDLEALDKARERKEISQETYWSELQRRGVLASDFTAVRERDRLLKELPGDEETVEEG